MKEFRKKLTLNNTSIIEFVNLNLRNWGKWKNFFSLSEVQSCLQRISDQIAQDIKTNDVAISPPLEEIFEAFIKTPLERVKALILGQDPAPEAHLADGLSFCVQGVSSAHVPSIQRVLLEVRNEGFNVDILDGDIEPWAYRGVLLLNSVLTIPIPYGKTMGIIDAHKDYWLPFTKLLFHFLNNQSQTIVYILFGSQAGRFAKYIDNPQQKVLLGGHPSPEAPSQRFFCKNYFIHCNQFLQQHAVAPINWSLLPEALPKDTPKGVWTWSPAKRKSLLHCPCS